MKLKEKKMAHFRPICPAVLARGHLHLLGHTPLWPHRKSQSGHCQVCAQKKQSPSPPDSYLICQGPSMCFKFQKVSQLALKTKVRIDPCLET